MVGRFGLWLGIGFGLGTDFQAVVVPGGVTFRGRVARAKAAEVRDFLRREFPGGPPFAFAGTLRPGRALGLRWAGRATPATRQRVRNVLTEVFR